MEPKYKIKASISHDDKTFVDYEFYYKYEDDLCFWMKHIFIIFYNDYRTKTFDKINEYDPDDSDDIFIMTCHNEKLLDFIELLDNIQFSRPKNGYDYIIDFFGHMSDYSLYVEPSEHYY